MNNVCRIIDNMPVALCFDTLHDKQYCTPDLPFGCFVRPDGVRHYACQIDVRNTFRTKNNYYRVYTHIMLQICFHIYL